ncbi:hypothetical protein, partial [Pseudomonas aeruginosa]|uniref:hypothetical protein n=1 Tax=Pseudomonas aeruginosa TaxID=287 RepID=UPI001EE1B8D3
GAGCRYAQGPGRQQRVVGGAGILRPAQELAAGMRKGQAANSEWWEAPGYSALQDGLPQDLVDDFRHLGAGEDAA